MANGETAAVIETLENRQLLSSASIVNGVLRVRGERLVKNVITVGLAADGKIAVAVSATASNGATRSFTQEFATTGITSLHIFGGRKADHITIDQSLANFTLPTTIDAGKGNDTIMAGNENDAIFGGFGNDAITTGDGNDIVHGGRGNDSITAGNGNDILWGGRGADTIDAGNGNDILGGILGKNTLIAGSGHDTFYVTALSDNVTNFDASKDVLKVVHHGDGDNATSTDPTAAQI